MKIKEKKRKNKTLSLLTIGRTIEIILINIVLQVDNLEKILFGQTLDRSPSFKILFFFFSPSTLLLLGSFREKVQKEMLFGMFFRLVFSGMYQSCNHVYFQGNKDGGFAPGIWIYFFQIQISRVISRFRCFKIYHLNSLKPKK